MTHKQRIFGNDGLTKFWDFVGLNFPLVKILWPDPLPETRAYCISGSAELFPQCCQVPCLRLGEHLWELSNEMVAALQAMRPSKQKRVLTLMQHKIATHQDTLLADNIVTHPLHEWMLPGNDPQQLPRLSRVARFEQRVPDDPEEQRVITPLPLC